MIYPFRVRCCWRFGIKEQLLWYWMDDGLFILTLQSNNELILTRNMEGTSPFKILRFWVFKNPDTTSLTFDWFLGDVKIKPFTLELLTIYIEERLTRGPDSKLETTPSLFQVRWVKKGFCSFPLHGSFRAPNCQTKKKKSHSLQTTRQDRLFSCLHTQIK